MENNKIMTDSDGRVRVIREDGSSGKHGYTENWVKLIVQRKGNFITLQGKKVDVNTLERSEYTYNTGLRDITVTCFTVK